MTCSLLTPWWRDRRPVEGDDALGSREPTRILDWRAAIVQSLVADVRATAPADSRALLAAAHAVIAERVAPAYSLNDTQRVSQTLSRGRGSCSQRLAVLEAVARASDIRTRVRGLLVDGAFWYPRFPRLRYLVPDRVLLAWPEFSLPEGWVSAGELFGELGDLARSARPFTNADGQTLFDALASTAIDWDGVTRGGGACSVCDLSARVLVDLGRYDSRDLLFTAHGQTLSPVPRWVADPVFRRRSARRVD